ncbi:MAG: nuclear transport factor 2 family protein [Bdellovibrionota bacterium]
MQKKDIAISFLKMAGSGEVKAAYEKFIAPDFIHHNQYFKGDRQSLLSAMEKAHKIDPNKAIEIKRVIEEGDTVVTHSRVIRDDPTALELAVVHIFKFKNDQVAELWDLGQLISKDSPNENGPF